MDLSAVPVVDNHAHPLTVSQPRTVEEFRGHFGEAHSEMLAREHVASAGYYRWAIRQLGQLVGAEGGEEAILARRAGQPLAGYARELVSAANIGVLLVDEGYPPPDISYSADELERMLEIPVRRMLRIETLLQELMRTADSFADLAARFDEATSDLRRHGYVALKSIAAYRTGLQIEVVEEPEAERAFEAEREDASGSAAYRLASKPLIDHFVRRAVRHAAEQEVPVQFHTGYGDPDLDLRLANPLHLRPLFEDRSLETAPIVLLHASFPYTAEAAFLAAVYPNAYLDLAFSLPPLGRLELVRIVETALGVAPASKLMCSSDGTSIPEHYWLGAARAREILSDVLTRMVEGHELSEDDGEEMGGMVLNENAMRVYRLDSLGR